MPKNINFSKSSKFSDEDLTPDEYSEMTDVKGAEDYDPGKYDPLAKQRSEAFMGQDIDFKLAGATRIGAKSSYAVGPISDPTQYGRPGKMEEIPFEREQTKALGAELADESAIEAALDAEIDKLDIAQRNADPVGIMEAETKIKGLQNELTKAIKVTATKKETFGEAYETQYLKETISKRLKGKVTPENLELMAEDVKPLPTTPKGKGPGIKAAESIIQSGVSPKKLPTDKLAPAKFTEEKIIKGGKLVGVKKIPLPKGEDIGYGEYSQSKSSMKSVSIERELNQPKGIDEAAVDNTSQTSGSLKEVMAAREGKIDPITQKPYKTMTGVTKAGDIQLNKMPETYFPTTEIDSKGKPMKGDFYFRETGPTPSESLAFQEKRKRMNIGKGDVRPGDEALDDYPPYSQKARIAERRGQKPTGQFQTKKVSGTKVSSVTPDAPKQQQYSGLKEVDSPELKQYVDEFKAAGQTSQRALRNAQRMMKLQKIRGKGKGKGKLLTTLGAVGIGAILSKNLEK